MILLVLGVLAALLGLVTTVVATISLQNPFTFHSEFGTRYDITNELLAARAVGVLLVMSGLGVAVRLVRAQLR